MCLCNFQMNALHYCVLHLNHLLFETTELVGVFGLHDLLENRVAHSADSRLAICRYFVAYLNEGISQKLVSENGCFSLARPLLGSLSKRS